MQTTQQYAMIKRFITIAALLLAVTSVSSFALAHQQHQHHKMYQQVMDIDKQALKMHKRMHRLTKVLALSEAQQAEIMQLFTEQKAERLAQKTALSGFKTQLQGLTQASEFDENQFNAIYAEFQPAFQAMAMQKAKMHHGVLQVLTPQQQQKYLKMRRHR
ncbi:Heavy-metal resistance [Colwellia chukchiensis]|uniref:Heavy-metal resistance n=1 Tax=Colwellia chukchiensis TaxID=641665 RepID=A0A1H7T7B9_9GAMM|nr:Spy/CpxP family protein refolding chaperone [Colwellia chukchiensis]SEL80653.1 Heavy-metal resistance [Colwellia chukchiensis]